MKFPNIAVIGGMGAGKSTITGQLVRIFGYQRMSWADPVKQIAAMAYGPVQKNDQYTTHDSTGLYVVKTGRQILQQIGTEALRQSVDEDFWIKCGVRRMDETDTDDKGRPYMRWANDDSRFPNEVSALRERGWTIVRLLAPDELRAERLGISYEQLIEASAHPSEQQIAQLEHDMTVWNDSDPEAVARSIIGQIVGSEPVEDVA